MFLLDPKIDEQDVRHVERPYVNGSEKTTRALYDLDAFALRGKSLFRRGSNIGRGFGKITAFARRVGIVGANVIEMPDGGFQCATGPDGGTFTNRRGTTCRPDAGGVANTTTNVTQSVASTVEETASRLPKANLDPDLVQDVDAGDFVEAAETVTPSVRKPKVEQNESAISRRLAARVVAFDATDTEFTRTLFRGTKYTAKRTNPDDEPPDEAAAEWLQELEDDGWESGSEDYLSIQNENGEEVGQLIFKPYEGDYSPDEKMLYIDSMTLVKSEQGKGSGSKILNNLIEVAKADDHVGIRLTANISVGGYAWARLGFLPENGPSFARYMLRRFDHLRQPDGSMLQEVMNEDTGEIETFVMSAADAAMAQSLAMKMVKPDGSFDPEVFRQFSAVDDIETIMMGTYWDAVLRFDDPDSMAMVMKNPKREGESASKSARASWLNMPPVVTASTISDRITQDIDQIMSQPRRRDEEARYRFDVGPLVDMIIANETNPSSPLNRLDDPSASVIPDFAETPVVLPTGEFDRERLSPVDEEVEQIGDTTRMIIPADEEAFQLSSPYWENDFGHKQGGERAIALYLEASLRGLHGDDVVEPLAKELEEWASGAYLQFLGDYIRYRIAGEMRAEYKKRTGRDLDPIVIRHIVSRGYDIDYLKKLKANLRGEPYQFEIVEGYVPPLTRDEALARFYVDSRQSYWAHTSGNGDPSAQMLQYAAIQSGIASKDSKMQHMYEQTDGMRDADAAEKLMLEGYASQATLLQETVRGAYAYTQQRLKAFGITEVTVYRGVRGLGTFIDRHDLPLAMVDGQPSMLAYRFPGSPPYGLFDYTRAGRMSVITQPLSSFSADPTEALNFGSIIYVVKVPASRIFSMPGSGFGSAGEREFIITGGTDPMSFYAYFADDEET